MPAVPGIDRWFFVCQIANLLWVLCFFVAALHTRFFWLNRHAMNVATTESTALKLLPSQIPLRDCPRPSTLPPHRRTTLRLCSNNCQSVFLSSATLGICHNQADSSWPPSIGVVPEVSRVGSPERDLKTAFNSGSASSMRCSFSASRKSSN